MPEVMSSGDAIIDLAQSADEMHSESEEQLNLLQTITREVAAATDLRSALEAVLHDVCEKTGWVLGHAWVPNPDAAVLDVVAAWYCADAELTSFRRISEGSHFELGVGLPGRHQRS